VITLPQIWGSLQMTGYRGRPIVALSLSDDERRYLEQQVRRHRAPRSLSDRCCIILRCADGLTSKEVGVELGFHEHTVGKCYKRHRAKEFLDFMKEIDAQVANDLDIHIIMDNYATHKTKEVKAWLSRRPHYHVHFTPTSASWINQIERWFAELTRKQLKRGVHTTVKHLEADIMKFVEVHNENLKPFKWIKSADEILASVKRFCHRVDKSFCAEL